MTLAEFMEAESLTQVQAGARFGVSQTCIWRVLQGKHISVANALKIEAGSGGQVPTDAVCPQLAAIRNSPSQAAA